MGGFQCIELHGRDACCRSCNAGVQALTLLRSGDIDAIPRQETTKGASKEDPLAGLADIGSMGVEDIAEAIGKTARGVKTMLTRRGLSAADYDGAAKKEKASA